MTMSVSNPSSHDASTAPLTACVAIPTYLREDVLVETIQQVIAQNPPASEVLVIDQSPEHDPQTDAFLSREHAAGRLRWIRHSPPNLPGARNRALKETNCDVVIFIDDDVILTPGFVAHHLANYADPKVVGVAGRTLQPNHELIPRRDTPWPRNQDYLYLELDGTQRIEGVSSFIGANHSVRRSAALEIGGYDENFIGPANREDGDLCFRLWKRGGIIVFDPVASLRHLASPAGGCQTRTSVIKRPAWLKTFGEHYFLWRHFFPSPHFFGRALFVVLRQSVFDRQMFRTPLRIPGAIVAYFHSLTRAGYSAFKMRRSPGRIAP